MRPGSTAVTVVGFASSLAAAAATLPASQPLASDPATLVVVWAAAAAAADGLTRTGRHRATTALTLLLCLACLAGLAAGAVRGSRWSRPGIVLVLLGTGVVSLLPALLGWRRGRPWRERFREGQERQRTAGGQPVGDAGGPTLLPVAGGPTRPVPRTAGANRVLHDRWRLEPGPLDGADRGGFSVLCRATDLRQPERSVVVKLASRSFGIEADSVARLLREAKLLGGLDDPHVIGLLDSGWEAGAFFLVLEHHPAGSLARWLDRRFVLQLSTAIEVTCELLRALVYLHERLDWPVIHRDLTPRNILIRSESPRLRLVLTDFGSARRLDLDGPTTDAAITVGSVFSRYYASPELVGGPHHGWWGPETDLYGACAVLYELLTGLPPYQREASRERVDFQRLVLDPTVVPTPPGQLVRGLPRILDRVITAGLAPDPAARPARASDLLGLLEDVGRHHSALRIPFADLRRSA
jgi:Protein kinase domain